MQLTKEQLESIAVKIIESLDKERFKYESAIEGVKLLVQELLKLDGDKSGSENSKT